MYNLVNTVFMMNGSCTFREMLSEKFCFKVSNMSFPAEAKKSKSP